MSASVNHDVEQLELPEPLSIKRANLPPSNNDLKLKLTWENLTYTVKAKYTKNEKEAMRTDQKYYQKQLIKGVSGYCAAGETLFIMGSSGAGKTTLLNVLSDRVLKNKNNQLEGEIKINDSYPVSKKDFGAYAGYVTQDDYLYTSFSCEQAIMFAGKLRLKMPTSEIKERVDQLVEALGLIKCRKTMIGNERIKGLSGGEKKRTAIAIEMITDPAILFLDEPTSGLDSFTAKKIVELLVEYANMGKMVISTIHQPSSETFQMFGRLLLLMDGHTIYQGDAMNSVQYFRDLGYAIPEFSNPADYYLKEFYVPYIKSVEDKHKVDNLRKSYEDTLEIKAREDSNNINFPEINKSIIKENSVSINWFYEFWILIQRTFIGAIFHPELPKMKLIASVFMSLICLSIFFDLDNTEEGVRSKIGASFFMCCFSTYFPAGNTVVSFSEERPVFLREYSNKTYGMLSYGLAKSLVEIPFEMFPPIIFSSIVYFGIGFDNSFGNFIIFMLALVLNTSVATSVGLAIAAGITDPSTANSSMPAFVAPMVLFSGAAANLKDVYVWLRWLQYLSPIRYSMEIITRNEFEDSNVTPDPVERLDYDLGITECFISLIALAIGFRVLAIIFLRLTIKTV